MLVEALCDSCSETAECGIKCGDKCNGEELRIRERDDDRAHVADEETYDEADQDNVDHLFPSSRSVVSRA